MDDITVVEKQLKRTTASDFRVVFRCDKNFPAVIRNKELTRDGRPFPTPFWLTCPALKKDISRIESAGGLKSFQKKLKEDHAARSELLNREKRIRKSRKTLEGLAPDVGITGNREPLRLKCLHAHTADFLAGEQNPIGRLVMEDIAWPEDCQMCDR